MLFLDEESKEDHLKHFPNSVVISEAFATPSANS